MVSLLNNAFTAFFKWFKPLLVLVLILVFGCKTIGYQPFRIPENFDWQGHRGARGLMPENTIPAFLRALELGVTTLEMDLAVSKEGELIVSHEPYMSPEICTDSKGNKILEDSAKQNFALHNMTVAEIQTCDCGSLKHPRFPLQNKRKVYKPTLEQVVNMVFKHFHNALHIRKYTGQPQFNIEIKSKPEWDNILTPSVSEFAKLVVDKVNQLKINELTTIQSFDLRALEAVKKLDKHLKIALLVENTNGVKLNLNGLSFKPDIYSPNFKLVDLPTVQYCHQQQIRIIPWTVNDTTDMISLIRLGVDGIITDYPNKILQQ
jgi:glycerophosphoryl diester phosphodiesterase